MDSKQQKKVLAFLRQIEHLRKTENLLEKHVKAGDAIDAAKQAREQTLTRMHIDRELPDCIKICMVEQLKLGL